MTFTRLPVAVKHLTTCCDDCGGGLEVRWVRQRAVSESGVSIPTYREAEAALDAWEAQHVCQPVSVPLAAV